MKKRSYIRQHIDWSDPVQVRLYKREHSQTRRNPYKSEWKRNWRRKYAGTVFGIRVQTNLLQKLSRDAELEIARL